MNKPKSIPSAPNASSKPRRPEPGRLHRTPLDYEHPYRSMAESAKLLKDPAREPSANSETGHRDHRRLSAQALPA